MPFKRVSLAVAAALVSAVGAVDYCFPSPTPPGDRDPASLEQYATITWDDNIYTGLDGTYYKSDSGFHIWYEEDCVGGKEGLKTHGFPAWVPSKNRLDIEEGDMGMSWAMQLEVPMTFNMITGLYVPISNPKDSPNGEGWANRESPLGFWVPNDIDEKDMGHKYTRHPVAWGTEHTIVDGGEQIQPGCYAIATNQAIAQGHEIGNHTIDHMSADSPLPGGSSPFAENGFGRWSGEGFDTAIEDTMPWGEIINEADLNNEPPGYTSHTSGWKIKAGSYLSTNAWKGVIDLSEEWLFKRTDASKNTLYGFSAPRQEVSSGLFHALAQRGYQYDCSVEEGLEEHRDGTNFLWPYTVDNGTQNSWTQYNLGERRLIHDMPTGTGLWEIPLNPLIVPEAIRESVWENHAKVLLGQGVEQDELDESKAKWLTNGKIKAIDFDALFLWGMSHENWLKTMQNTLDLRLAGNKAPFHYRAHSQYYTPTYDNGTLLTSKHINGLGLSVTKGWNNWRTRISSMEEWITNCQGKGVKFVTGHQLIEEIKKISETAHTLGEEVAHYDKFYFNKNHQLPTQTTTNVTEFEESADVQISIAHPQNGKFPYPSYYSLPPQDEFYYMSLKYQISRGALAIRLYFTEKPSREIILNNTGTKDLISSGYIPITAFDYNQFENPDMVDYSKDIDLDDLCYILISPLAPTYKIDGSHELRDEPFDIHFRVEDITFYKKGNVSLEEKVIKKRDLLSIQTGSNNNLQLQTTSSGNYTLGIYTITGRLVQSYNKLVTGSGNHSFPLGNISKGVYIVKVADEKGTVSMTQKVSLR